ncbi:hypothetical protein ACI79C_19915 [Geodermatophilus sp. SYSU D00697]
MDVLAVPGQAVDTVLLAGAVAAVGALGVVAMRHAPRLALAVWLLVLCLVPVWAGISIVLEWEPEVLVTLVVLAVLVSLRPRGGAPLAGRLTLADGVVVLFVLAGLVPIATGATSISDVFVLVAQWTGAFLVGRLVGQRVGLQWVYGAVAVAFTLVAVLALVEFATGWNPFVQIPGQGRLHVDWAPIQERGGRARAEGAFGHSIALGASLALAVPLTLAAPFRAAVRVPMAVLMVAASAVTFSRVGLATAVFGIALCVAFLRSGLSTRVRVVVTAGLVVVGAGFASLLSGVFAAAGSEATDSAGYRWALLELVPDIELFGRSSSAYGLASGERFFGGFRSIDNALLLLGLRYGWVPLVLVTVLLLAACGYVLSGRATAPTIAVVAQIPSFVSVALITQYATFLWFVAGLAVYSQSVARKGVQPARNGPLREVGPSPEMVRVPVG